MVDVGPARVTAVLDAEGPFFSTLSAALPGAGRSAREGARALDPSAFRVADGWWLAFRTYVVEVGERVVLVDTGAASDTALRPSWAPSAPDHLADRLADRTGIGPDRVTDVVLTHLHADHAAGSVDAAGAPAFANATYLVQDAELATLGSGSALAAGLVAPLEATGQLRNCAGQVELMPRGSGVSVRLVPTPGHTPGHQSVVVAAGDALVALAGDVFVHALQVVDPAQHYVHETDPEQAATSRTAVLELLGERGGRLGTAHLGVPFLEIAAAVDGLRG